MGQYFQWSKKSVLELFKKHIWGSDGIVDEPLWSQLFKIRRHHLKMDERKRQKVGQKKVQTYLR